MFVGRLNGLKKHANIARTKITKFVIYVRELPNKTFKSDGQILYCQYHDKPVMTNQRNRILGINNDKYTTKSLYGVY